MSGRVLLTGASGFIGRHAIAPLRTRGFEVHAVARRPPTNGGAAENRGAESAAVEGAHWHAADLLAPGAAERVMAVVRPTHLLHLAWYVTPGAFWAAPENLRWVAASLELVRAFREAGGARAVVAGTCAEYDWARGHCIEDETPLAPATLYGACKDALRRVVEAYARTSGLSASWGRVFLLHGPHEPAGRLVSSVAAALVRGEPARSSHGEQVRDFLHVADVADAFAAIVASDVRGAVNVASGTPVALKAVVRELARRAGREDLVRLGALPAGPNEAPAVTADVGRLRDEVGWTPVRDLGAGLQDTLDWWRTHLAAPATEPHAE